MAEMNPGLNKTIKTDDVHFEPQYKQLGKGGFGTVFTGVNRKDGKQYAIKVLRKDFYDFKHMTEGDMKEMIPKDKNLHHPNVINIFHYLLFDDNARYIIMELCDCSIMDYMKSVEGDLDESSQSKFRWQIISGLAYLHEQRIVHRDMKPDNLLMKRDRDGNIVIKLADFGLAKVLDDDESYMSTTNRGNKKWMPPEYLQKDKKYNRSADIFPTGKVFLYLALDQEKRYRICAIECKYFQYLFIFSFTHI